MSNKVTPIDGVRSLLQRNFFGLAEERLLYLLEQTPDDPRLMRLLFGTYFKLGDYFAAIDVGRRLLEQEPGDAPSWRQLSQSLLRTGQRQAAWDAALQFQEVSGNRPEVLPLLIDNFERNNQLDEAEELLSEMSTADGMKEAKLYFAARLLVQRKKYDEAIEMIAKGQAVSENDKHLMTEYYYLLCKANDRSGDYDAAWDAATNAHKVSQRPWNQAKYDQALDSLQSFFTRDMLQSLSAATNHEEQPILICGNPRSGTSLLEQILSMHPEIDSGGEMSATSLMENRTPRVTDSYHDWPMCLLDMKSSDADALADIYVHARRCVNPDCVRVTNKSLVLQQQLGFLSLVFPAAKAIDLRRHPLDNCVSCYTTSIGSVGHNYTHSLEDMGRTWVTRRKLRNYWQETLDMPILELQYEQLVTDQENQTRRLLEFLGVAWEPKCLDFHKSKRVPATISYDQVNKKMYTSSSGRWKRYEKHLGPLIDIFSEGGYL